MLPAALHRTGNTRAHRASVSGQTHPQVILLHKINGLVGLIPEIDEIGHINDPDEEDHDDEK